VVYKSKAHSGNVATLLQCIAYTAKISLSMYPLTDGKRYFLAVIVDDPPTEIQFRIREALLSGREVDLPTDFVTELIERHRLETGVVTHG
jgi:hypothetical protein